MQYQLFFLKKEFFSHLYELRFQFPLPMMVMKYYCLMIQGHQATGFLSLIETYLNAV